MSPEGIEIERDVKAAWSPDPPTDCLLRLMNGEEVVLVNISVEIDWIHGKFSMFSLPWSYQPFLFPSAFCWVLIISSGELGNEDGFWKSI